MRPQCIVFDLDDTLYLERDYVHSGFRALAEWAKTSLGVPDFADRAFWLNVELKPEPGIVAHMVNLYRCRSPEIELLPDAVQCLSKGADRINGAKACETD
jgi:putative hydrolase of the HAD superfamily